MSQLAIELGDVLTALNLVFWDQITRISVENTEFKSTMLLILIPTFIVAFTAGFLTNYVVRWMIIASSTAELVKKESRRPKIGEQEVKLLPLPPMVC